MIWDVGLGAVTNAMTAVQCFERCLRESAGVNPRPLRLIIPLAPGGATDPYGRLVAEAVGVGEWAIVYQSRSGRPEDPWLGPDILEYLPIVKAEGVEAVVIASPQHKHKEIALAESFRDQALIAHATQIDPEGRWFAVTT